MEEVTFMNAIIFDVDGTLLGLLSSCSKCLEYCFDRYKELKRQKVTAEEAKVLWVKLQKKYLLHFYLT